MRRHACRLLLLRGRAGLVRRARAGRPSRSASPSPPPARPPASACRSATRSPCCRPRSPGRRSSTSCSTTAPTAPRAVANARKLIDEDNVDALIGSQHHARLARDDRRGGREEGADDLARPPQRRLIEPMDAPRHWVFKTPQNDSLMADAIADHMATRRRQDGRLHRLQRRLWRRLADGGAARAFKAKDIQIVAIERYARNDTSVTGQVLKLVAAQARRGADRRRRHAGRAAAEDAARARLHRHDTTRRTASPTPTSCASAARTWRAPSCRPGPILVAAQLPDEQPDQDGRAPTTVTRYEAANGAGQRRHLRRPCLRRGHPAARTPSRSR